MSHARHLQVLSALLLTITAQCDAVLPEGESQLVVEAYIAAEEPLPTLRLWRALAVDEPYPFDATTAALDAEVTLSIGSAQVAFRPRKEEPGVYEPVEDRTAPARSILTLDARWRGQRALATSRVPPPLKLDSVRVQAPQKPVDGIILDSLIIDPLVLDSLRLDSLRTGAKAGLVYLVEVTLFWRVDYEETGADSVYWISTQLRPSLPRSGALNDYFLRPKQLSRERVMPSDAMGRRRWTGVYAVPVESRESKLPAHMLRVAIVRSGRDYARFVSGSDDPERREPPSNVQGASGILAGVSIDSVHVLVE